MRYFLLFLGIIIVAFSYSTAYAKVVADCECSIGTRISFSGPLVFLNEEECDLNKEWKCRRRCTSQIGQQHNLWGNLEMKTGPCLPHTDGKEVSILQRKVVDNPVALFEAVKFFSSIPELTPMYNLMILIGVLKEYGFVILRTLGIVVLAAVAIKVLIAMLAVATVVKIGALVSSLLLFLNLSTPDVEGRAIPGAEGDFKISDDHGIRGTLLLPDGFPIEVDCDAQKGICTATDPESGEKAVVKASQYPGLRGLFPEKKYQDPN